MKFESINMNSEKKKRTAARFAVFQSISSARVGLLALT